MNCDGTCVAVSNAEKKYKAEYNHNTLMRHVLLQLPICAELVDYIMQMNVDYERENMHETLKNPAISARAASYIASNFTGFAKVGIKHNPYFPRHDREEYTIIAGSPRMCYDVVIGVSIKKNDSCPHSYGKFTWFGWVDPIFTNTQRKLFSQPISRKRKLCQISDH